MGRDGEAKGGFGGVCSEGCEGFGEGEGGVEEGCVAGYLGGGWVWGVNLGYVRCLGLLALVL